MLPSNTASADPCGPRFCDPTRAMSSIPAIAVRSLQNTAAAFAENTVRQP